MTSQALICFYNPNLCVPCTFIKNRSSFHIVCPSLDSLLHGKFYNNVYLLKNSNGVAILHPETLHTKRIASLAGYWTNTNQFFRIIIKQKSFR